MVDVKAPMVNMMEDIPAKSTVAMSLVIKSYRTMVKMYVKHALYSRVRPPMKLMMPMRNNTGRLTEYDRTPWYIVEKNSSRSILNIITVIIPAIIPI